MLETGDGRKQRKSWGSASEENPDLSLVLTLLKNEGKTIEIDSLVQESNLPEEALLQAIHRLEESELINKTVNDKVIVAPAGKERLKLAIAAVTLGATVETSASMLSWREFESFSIRVLEENGYSCIQGFRFKSAAGKRFECDVVATRKPLVLVVDCKHYGGRVRGLLPIVERHLERVSSFARIVSTLMRQVPQIAGWNEAEVTPVIITLFPENMTIVNDVPIVPAFKLNQFLQEIHSNIDRITHIVVEPSKQRRLT